MRQAGRYVRSVLHRRPALCLLLLLPCLLLTGWLVFSRYAPPPFPQMPKMAAVPAPTQPPCPPPPSLDYLEIGTSDFGTIVQAVDEMPYMAQLKKVLRGTSVDAMSVYLDRLPTHPTNHRKLNFAVTGVHPHPATLPVYFIEPSDIATYGLEDFLRGCNRVGAPHPLAVSELNRTSLSHLLQKREVPVASIPELLLLVGACRLSLLKVDVEGLDAELMLSYVAFLWANPQCRADLLLFEERNLGRNGSSGLDYPHMFQAVGIALRGVGYEAAFNPPGPQGYPVRDALWVWSAARDSRLWAARAAVGQVAAQGLSEEAVGQLMQRGRGGEGEGEGEVGAAQADITFALACRVPVPLPAEGMPQGRSNSTEALRFLALNVI
jgi:hypothetical protein